MIRKYRIIGYDDHQSMNLSERRKWRGGQGFRNRIKLITHTLSLPFSLRHDLSIRMKLNIINSCIMIIKSLQDGFRIVFIPSSTTTSTSHGIMNFRDINQFNSSVFTGSSNEFAVSGKGAGESTFAMRGGKVD